jgi:hypothetical protein
MGVVLSGGDGYPGGRFLGVPLLYLVAGAVVAAGGLKRGWRLLPLAVMALFVYGGMRFVARRVATVRAALAEWPLSEHLFDCEVEVAGVLHRHATSIAETDWERVKFYDDTFRVIDLSSLNDMAAAHAPWPGQNLWGKLNLRPEVFERGIDALVLGHGMNLREPMSRYAAADIVGSDAVSGSELGFVLPPEARPILAERYVPAAVPVCGVYFNLFVRRELAEAFAREKVLVGR